MMRHGCDNAVAVVTGGSSGIGLATVRILLENGARVALCARKEGRLNDVTAVLATEFGADRILVRALSVLEPAAVNAFAAVVQERFERCDLLVNNAGQGRVSTFADTTDEDWRAEYELKLFSQVLPIRAFLPMQREARGAIVAVNSLLAYQPESHMVCTSSARAGGAELAEIAQPGTGPRCACQFGPAGPDRIGAMDRPLCRTGRPEHQPQ